MKKPFSELNILIVDDHQLVVDGLKRILKDVPGVSTVFEAKNGTEAIRMVQEQAIDCIFMDIDMPDINGIEATRIIRNSNQHIKIIMVSMHSDPGLVSRILRAGADGFVIKNAGKEELIISLEKAMSGEKYICKELSLHVWNHLAVQEDEHTHSKPSVSARELEIIRHIAAGETHQEIARKLFLSPATVDTHRKNILAKLQLKNIASLVRHAIESKWV
jgi:DNA-binding NarL/FixJ family response regulator